MLYKETDIRNVKEVVTTSQQSVSYDYQKSLLVTMIDVLELVEIKERNGWIKT